MLRIEAGASDIVATRFALSPITQVVAGLHALAGRLPPGTAGPWTARFRPRYLALRRANDDLAALAFMLRSRGYNPDFIAPPPQGQTGSIEADLAAVRATPAERARQEIRQALLGRSAPPALRKLLAAPDVSARVAGALGSTWSELVAPEWDAIQAVLERDIAQHAGGLAAYGWERALASVSPDVRCRSSGSRVFIEIHRMPPEHRMLDGQGMLFLPNAFGALWLCLDRPWRVALTYPATGVGDLWTGSSAAPVTIADSLNRLVGFSRARLLRALDEPATTTQLVAVLGMSLGNVGDQLGVLRQSGLVQGRRIGRAVVYSRTPLGTALTRPQADGAEPLGESRATERNTTGRNTP